MATKYDPSIIQQFADRLYKQADTIVVFYALAGLVLGGIGGAAAGAASGNVPVLALFGAALVAALFAAAGRARAFVLRLQAQTALCQRQIELNTKGH